MLSERMRNLENVIREFLKSKFSIVDNCNLYITAPYKIVVDSDLILAKAGSVKKHMNRILEKRHSKNTTMYHFIGYF